MTMGERITTFGVFIISFLLVSLAQGRDFNVLQYGAIADGRSDNAKAFANAWRDACGLGGSKLLVPAGTYMVSTATFQGPCKGPISFEVRGIVKAFTNVFSRDEWIHFRYIDRLSVGGGGTFDGQGDLAWSANSCRENFGCINLPANIGFAFVTNSRVGGIASLNSKSTHINLYGCNNVTLTGLAITAPADSPNTDGIRIGSSTLIRISRTIIATGDDCISILAGTQNLLMTQVMCGPGHGISVGSLGRYQTEKDVMGVRVRNCTFVGTQNGVRIKSWASAAVNVAASHMSFQNVEMRGVSNPIIIDQNYCPYPPCAKPGGPQVWIHHVTFRNIWGTSMTKAAVILRCSSLAPCKNINIFDINLAYRGPATTDGVETTSECFHANGVASGLLRPRPCLQ